jgi:hypothetical protein
MGFMAWVWLNGIRLACFDQFRFSVWVVHLSELVKYLLIGRYLAAKIGTISLILVWWVFCITCNGSDLISLLVLSFQ